MRIAVMEVEPAVKYSFVLKGMQMRQKGQYNAASFVCQTADNSTIAAISSLFARKLA